MPQLGDRIQQLRKKMGMSQTTLAEAIQLSYAQISRYENKGAQPPAAALKKLANVLKVSPDYLLYGSTDEKAEASLNDAQLIQQFKAVEQMTDEDQTIIKKLIDAFIVKRQVQQLGAS